MKGANKIDELTKKVVSKTTKKGKKKVDAAEIVDYIIKK